MVDVRLALGMIVFNGMPFVEGVLNTFYPHVDQIVVAEGPVSFWHNRGYERSSDGTVEYLQKQQLAWGSRKLRFTLGVWRDKLEMCRAWFSLLNDDITHVAVMDADEFMHGRDILQVKEYLAQGYDSIGLMLRTLVGGFNHYLTGFEQKPDTIRFLRRRPGDEYISHRPPTIGDPADPCRERRHLDFQALAQAGIYLYHYSHVLPAQVQMKEQYYADYIGSHNVIHNYYERVWKPWVLGDERAKQRIEQVWGGIHDFHPRYRGECYSAIFHGHHPRWIEENKERIMEMQRRQIHEGETQ